MLQSHMMGFHFINVWDADLTREILFSKDEIIGKENFGQEMTKRLIGDSIISVEGDEWKRQKKSFYFFIYFFFIFLFIYFICYLFLKD